MACTIKSDPHLEQSVTLNREMSESHDSAGRTPEESLDGLLEVLANERRRRILYYLDGKDDEVATFTELIDYVTVHEADSVDDLASDEVAVALYHTHIPRLEEAGLIEYDARSRTIRYREDPRMKPYLRKAREQDRS